MRDQCLKDHLNGLLDELGYDFAQFRIDDFVRWVSSRRGRPIRLVTRQLPPDLFGAWISSADYDYVFYEPSPAQVHTVHILLHELSHMLLNHKQRSLDYLAGVRLRGSGVLPPDLLALGVPGLFRTEPGADPQELEAETLSSLIQFRVFRQAGLAALTHISRDAAMQQFVHDMGFNR